MGEVERLSGPPALRLVARNGVACDAEDGAVSEDGAVVGTLVHGLLEDDGVRAALLAHLRARRGLAAPAGPPIPRREAEYDRLADRARREPRLGAPLRARRHQGRAAAGGGRVSRLAFAIAFLTRVPLPARLEAGAREVGRAMLFFPAVGAALGALLAAAGLGLSRALPLPLAAVLVVALGTAATGALHLDGLADTADGLGAAGTRSTRSGSCAITRWARTALPRSPSRCS